MISRELHLARLAASHPVTATLLELRLASTQSMPLAALWEADAALGSMTPRLRDGMVACHQGFEREMRSGGDRQAAALMGIGLLRHIMRRHQYLASAADWAGIGTQLYGEMLAGLVSAGADLEAMEMVVRAHAARLGQEILRHAAQCPKDEPVCATYSPELQLRILGLDPADAPGPILDIGCGEEGALVHHLIDGGRSDVRGIDLLCETAGPLVRVSWFGAPWPRDTWGTILSHHAFALHAHRAHVLGSRDKGTRHARLYMAILRSLKPGGSFRYAPSLPFLEGLLPLDEWHVMSAPITARLSSTCVTRKLPRAQLGRQN